MVMSSYSRRFFYHREIKRLTYFMFEMELQSLRITYLLMRISIV